MRNTGVGSETQTNWTPKLLIIKLHARNDVQPLRPELALMSDKNFRTIVIHSRNQILGGFDVDRLCPIFLSSIERTFLFIRQTQLFLKRFCKRNNFECFRENHSHQKLRPETREVLILMRMKPQDHPTQQAEPTESSK